MKCPAAGANCQGHFRSGVDIRLLRNKTAAYLLQFAVIVHRKLRKNVASTVGGCWIYKHLKHARYIF
jgi:hypothetical protein